MFYPKRFCFYFLLMAIGKTVIECKIGERKQRGQKFVNKVQHWISRNLTKRFKSHRFPLDMSL